MFLARKILYIAVRYVRNGVCFVYNAVRYTYNAVCFIYNAVQYIVFSGVLTILHSRDLKFFIRLQSLFNAEEQGVVLEERADSQLK